MFKTNCQKVYQNTRGKWLIRGTKRRKVSQLQSLEVHNRISWDYLVKDSLIP